MNATFARILSLRLGFRKPRTESLLGAAYDHAQPASPLPQNATDARLKLAQRRALKKRSNTPRKVLSNYERVHTALAKGQG